MLITMSIPVENNIILIYLFYRCKNILHTSNDAFPTSFILRELSSDMITQY